MYQLTKLLSTQLLELAGIPKPQQKPEWQAFIQYMSLSNQEGHLSVDTEKELNPDPEILMKRAEELSLPANFAELVEIGYKTLPESLFINAPLKREGNRIYFDKHYQLETDFIRAFQGFIKRSGQTFALSAASENRLKQLGNKLLPAQALAIKNALTLPFSILTGGPGTGKTFTAGQLIALLKAEFPEFEIALTAPTGKAAANLKKSAGALAPALTLHRLLNISPKQKTALHPLHYDLIVVDEASMIDMRLMGTLFASLKKGSRLLLIGDPNQLPPVECGAPFHDLVALCQQNPLFQNYLSSLQQSMRTDLQGIIKAAELAKNGFLPEILLDGVEWIDEPLHHQQLIDILISHYKDIDTFDHFRALSPLRKGLFGVDALNQELFHLLHSHSKCAYPIILTGNAPKLSLYNGETGTLKGDTAFFPDYEKGGLRSISKFLLPSYEPAYVLSVHKSQGSEFEEVLLIAPEGTEGFGRELLYTGMTRAKKRLKLWGERSTLTQTLAKTNDRISGIKERLSK